MPKLAMLAATFIATLATPALADDSPPERTIPVLIHAGGDLVLLDEFSCLRAACDGRVTPGRHHVTVKVEKDGDWVIDLERDIEIFAPTEIDVQRPGILRKIAFATTATGGAVVLVAIAFPLLSFLSPKSTVDRSTGQVTTSDSFLLRTSTPFKVAWIGSIGVGITLALVGAVSLSMTSGTSRIRSRRWALAPVVTLDSRDGAGAGVGFVTTF